MVSQWSSVKYYFSYLCGLCLADTDSLKQQISNPDSELLTAVGDLIKQSLWFISEKVPQMIV